MSDNRNAPLAEDLLAAAAFLGEAHDDPTEWDFEVLPDGTVFGVPMPPAPDDTEGLHVSRDLADELGKERLERYGFHVLESLAGSAWLLVEDGQVLCAGVATNRPRLCPVGEEDEECEP